MLKQAMRLDWALLDGWHEVSVTLCNSQTSECGTDVPGIAEKPCNMNVMHLYFCISEHSYSSSQRVLTHDAAHHHERCWEQFASKVLAQLHISAFF